MGFGRFGWFVFSQPYNAGSPHKDKTTQYTLIGPISGFSTRKTRFRTGLQHVKVKVQTEKFRNIGVLP